MSSPKSSRYWTPRTTRRVATRTIRPARPSFPAAPPRGAGSAMDRLLLLLPTTTYRTEDFLDAARALGVEVVCASEHPSTLEAVVPDNLLTLDFRNPTRAAEQAAAFARTHPLAAVVGVDDLTTVAAAAIAERLGLRSNSVVAARAARNKLEARRHFGAAGVPQPRYRTIPLDVDPAATAREVQYPCVLKPLALSASRGVIRADDPAQLVVAFHRIAAILRQADPPPDGDAARVLLAEEFVPGFEVAL